MARPVRLAFPSAVYHVTSRGNARQDIGGERCQDRWNLASGQSEAAPEAAGLDGYPITTVLVIMDVAIGDALRSLPTITLSAHQWFYGLGKQLVFQRQRSVRLNERLCRLGPVSLPNVLP